MYNSGLIGYQGASEACSPTPVRMPTLQERLELAVKQAEERLAEAKEAKDIFSRNPDLERLLNIMQKGGF